MPSPLLAEAHQPNRPRARRLPVFPIVLTLLLCPLFCLSSSLLVFPCDLPTKYYRLVKDEYPILPMPPGTMQVIHGTLSSDLRPGHASATAASWYEDVRYVNDASPNTAAAFYQHHGNRCQQITRPFPIGGFALELTEPYWECTVGAEPWSSGTVYVMPQRAYTDALLAVYHHPPADLVANSIDETVIRDRLDEIYGTAPPWPLSAPMQPTVLLATARWCEPV